MSVTIKLRKGTAAEWSANSSIILASGEPGFEVDTGRLKIGNGSTQWGSLAYSSVVPTGFLMGSGIGINLGANGSTATIAVSGSFVANTGTLDILQFNTNNGLVNAQGQMGWNSTQGTVDVALTSTAVIELGEHQMYRVRNTTNNTLYRGQPVYASGVHPNGLIIPNLYLSDDSIDEIRFIGLMYETVNNNNNGYAIAFGHMYNIDTRGNVASDIAVGDETWTDGDILYPHPTVAGKLTKVPPKHYIPIALILDAANNGKLYVRRDLGAGDLDDLHNVNVSGVTDGQFLQYNSSTDYWVASSSGNFTTLLVNGTGVSVSGHTHTSSNITDFTEAVHDVVGASGFLVGVSGISISYNDAGNTLTITGGGGATISNAGDNRVLTSDGTSTGINGESNLTFNGTTLGVTGIIDIDNLRLDGNTISSTNSNGNIVLAPNGTGDVQVDADTLRVGDSNALATITTNGTGNLVLNTNNGTNSGSITIQQGVDGDIILQPNGQGQLQGSSGGNARGIYATDWQRARNNNSQVAGGAYSVIGGGFGNSCSSTYTTVAGGYGNNSNGTYCTVAGGYGNTATNTASVVGGGQNNVATAQAAIVVGGFNNQASGGSSFVGGGTGNSATSNHSIICGGSYNQSTNSHSSVLGGSYNEATEEFSTILGGSYNKSSGKYSTAGGLQSYATLIGEQAYSAGMFVTAGDAQTRKFILRGRDQSSASINLKTDSNISAVANNNVLYIPPWTSWYFTIKVIGRRNSQLDSTSASSLSDTAIYRFEGAVENKENNGDSSNCIILPDSSAGSKTVIHEDNIDWDCNISILYDGNNPYLNIECSAGMSPEDIYWVASVDVVQVSVPIQGPTNTILACGFGAFSDGPFSSTSDIYYNNREYYTNFDGYVLYWNGNNWVISSNLGGDILYSSPNYTPIASSWNIVNGSSPVGDTYNYDITSACPVVSSSSSGSGSSSGSSSSGSSSSGSGSSSSGPETPIVLGVGYDGINFGWNVGISNFNNFITPSWSIQYSTDDVNWGSSFSPDSVSNPDLFVSDMSSNLPGTGSGSFYVRVSADGGMTWGSSYLVSN